MMDQPDTNENKNTSDTSVEEDGSFIYAIAPKPSTETSEQIGINTTPAFQCLDEV